MIFGHGFNKPIDGVSWPSNLEHLAFGKCFNQPLVDVTWPDTLRKLSFGNSFGTDSISLFRRSSGRPASKKFCRSESGSSATWMNFVGRASYRGCTSEG